jgi:hypothetical protein
MKASIFDMLVGMDAPLLLEPMAAIMKLMGKAWLDAEPDPNGGGARRQIAVRP